MDQPPLTLGIVGAAGRGGHYANLCRAVGGIDLVAVCDIRAEALAEAQRSSGARAAYTSYDAMLARADIDAVLIATPMPLHAEQSIAALASGRHVLCEVTAAVSLDEARRLRAAARSARGIYMLAENYGYQELNMLVAGMVREGLFGETYLGHGDYIHELKELIEATPWRRHWQAGLPGITYPTHGLGPLLDWMPGDRIAALTCCDSGSHHRDRRGEPYHHDSATIIARTVGGRQVQLRFDIISDRPHAMSRYQLQGTDACYESPAAEGEPGRLWCRALGGGMAWSDPRRLLDDPAWARRLLPEWYREEASAARGSGHGGGDHLVLSRFLQAARGRIPNPCDVDAALDLTLPGLVSQDPAAAEHWLPVPDPRSWEA